MRRRKWELFSSTDGAVAPTVALSLVALIAAGGIAFDYARMASLDTELQNAADQAALAAASQLDKEAGACARASAAALGLVANQTRFANDSGGLAVTIPSEPTCDATGNIRFYQNQARLPATLDANARFVEITVNGRSANFALTPIVAAYSSGTLTGRAFAGMGSAVCKVPPLMMCNPSPGTVFDPDVWKGAGLKLFMGGGNSWGPGAFGWLDVGATNNGTPDQRLAVALDNPNTNCAAESDVDVDTGVAASVLDALNIRFDIFANGWPKNDCYPASNCSPAYNSTKDVVRSSSPTGVNQCGWGNSEWKLPPEADQYIPTNSAGDDTQIVHMGYPMDVCHYPTSGRSCGTTNARFGDKYWRHDYYFATNHPGQTASGVGLGTSPTRYEVYQWEQGATGSLPSRTAGGLTQFGQAVCKAPGLQGGGGQPDRRVVAVAVGENCASLSGASTALQTGRYWAEVFLVQPSIARGSGPTQRSAANEIYVEIIGRANPTDSGAVAQVVTRDVPYLIE